MQFRRGGALRDFDGRLDLALRLNTLVSVRGWCADAKKENNLPEQIALPFEVPNLFAGFAEGKGLAKADASELILEFVVKDTVLKVFKTGVKEIRIPRDEIDFVRFTRNWFRATVYIRVKSIKWLADLPGCETGEVTLHIARRDREQAAEFVRVLLSG